MTVAYCAWRMGTLCVIIGADSQKPAKEAEV